MAAAAASACDRYRMAPADEAIETGKQVCFRGNAAAAGGINAIAQRRAKAGGGSGAAQNGEEKRAKATAARRHQRTGGSLFTVTELASQCLAKCRQKHSV